MSFFAPGKPTCRCTYIIEIAKILSNLNFSLSFVFVSYHHQLWKQNPPHRLLLQIFKEMADTMTTNEN
jgi:hypothetical protein